MFRMDGKVQIDGIQSIYILAKWTTISDSRVFVNQIEASEPWKDGKDVKHTMNVCLYTDQRIECLKYIPFQILGIVYCHLSLFNRGTRKHGNFCMLQ